MGRLPEEITVMEETLPVYGDFRRWILITKLFGEEKLPPEMKLETAAKIVLKTPVFHRTAEWMTAFGEAVTDFASCGEVRRCSGKASDPVFDFDVDADAVFAGFFQTYGIDLTETPMHWWKFTALLRNLPPETEFMRRIELRTLDLSRIGDDGVRKRLRQAKARVRLMHNS